MSLDPSKVSAVIVTRGNVPLDEIVASLIFDDVVVLDNSRESEDLMTAGLIEAVRRTKHRVIFSMDDDIVHSAENQHAILAAYEPGVLTGCMWPEWSDGARAQGIDGGYDDLVFYGSGAVYDRKMPTAAALRYLKTSPLDDFFLLWFSCIFGILAPTKQLDLRFDALPWAEGGRMADLPDGIQQKTEAIRRARLIRDGKTDPHDLYMAELGKPHGEHRFGAFA